MADRLTPTRSVASTSAMDGQGWPTPSYTVSEDGWLLGMDNQPPCHETELYQLSGEDGIVARWLATKRDDPPSLYRVQLSAFSHPEKEIRCMLRCQQTDGCTKVFLFPPPQLQAQSGQEGWYGSAQRIHRALLHDLNNALAGAFALSEIYESKLEPDHPFKQGFGHILSSFQRAQSLLGAIGDQLRARPGECRWLDLRNWLEGSATLWKHLLPDPFALRLEIPASECPAKLDPVRWFRLISLLLSENAQSPNPSTGLSISTKPGKDGLCHWLDLQPDESGGNDGWKLEDWLNTSRNLGIPSVLDRNTRLIRLPLSESWENAKLFCPPDQVQNFRALNIRLPEAISGWSAWDPGNDGESWPVYCAIIEEAGRDALCGLARQWLTRPGTVWIACHPRWAHYARYLTMESGKVCTNDEYQPELEQFLNGFNPEHAFNPDQSA